MSRLLASTILSFSRRTYAAAAALDTAVRAPATTATAIRAKAEPKQEIFWMRDPKTGYWVPENHFEDVDRPVDLRAEILTNKK